ncbi:putative transposon Tf2-9 polyprotein [Phytophthora infestans]|uniref:Putative transposon Tf2-9 polyprotein n=1 Tax=Phytophthora infestans TaxID=4787 RepID=A0A833WNF2_PHYIN|nr:putative transposon Tf2-9 polyprotein [Phytophthora infestans]KAF4146787.1 putative transposon Tf2-9 polyprotein [Phytophthora infestans]KAF4148973.1 putative transposon Tf2-9 polyprotein [Phytophthora infestans]
MKVHYDMNRKSQDFEVGHLVLLDGRNINIHHKISQNCLTPRFVKPYPIVEKVHRDSYKLAVSDGLKAQSGFHTSLLKEYRKDEQGSRNLARHITEAVIDYRKRREKEQCKIYWINETIKKQRENQWRT